VVLTEIFSVFAGWYTKGLTRKCTIPFLNNALFFLTYTSKTHFLIELWNIIVLTNNTASMHKNKRIFEFLFLK